MDEGVVDQRVLAAGRMSRSRKEPQLESAKADRRILRSQLCRKEHLPALSRAKLGQGFLASRAADDIHRWEGL